jgi:protein TonB
MAIADLSSSLLGVADRTALEGSFAQSLNLDEAMGFHEIRCSGGALLLRLSQSALRRLDRLVREAAKTGPGSETGGILIGAVAPDRSIVTLLDVAPIEIAHRSGPLYRASDADLRKFAEAIGQSSNGLRCVIGYFRSHLSKGTPETGVALRAEDDKLLRRFFSDDGCSFLLVHPGPDGPSTAWFCQWDGGEEAHLVQRLQLVAGQTAESAVPPNIRRGHKPIQLPVPEPEGSRPERALEATPPESVPPGKQLEAKTNPKDLPPWEREGFPQSHAGGARPVDTKRLGLKPILAAAGAILALVVIFALGRLSAPSKPAPEIQVLDLSVEVHDLIVELKWNAASPVIRDSERASLDIVEGSEVNRIELSQAQLRAGHYVLVPTREDLTCLMTVYRNQSAFLGATKHVHIDSLQGSALSAADATPPLQALRPAATAKPSSTASVPGGSVPGGSVPAARAVSDKPPAGPGTRVAEEPTPAKQTSFTPPPAVSRSAPVPRVEDPPELVSSLSSPAVPQVPASRLPAAVPAPAPVSASRAAATPPRSVYLEAVPLTRVNPALPAAARIEIRSAISIKVTMVIDARGRVTDARAPEGTDLQQRMLAPYALQAARMWRFDPALRDGVKVASETTVIFQFGKNM